MSRSDPKPGAQPGRPAEGMGGLAKGLAIIEAFAESRTRLTVADAARAAGATRASARRCLLTLAELGYLEHDGKFFRPQPRLLRLGNAYSEARSLPQIAQPILAAARDELRESVSLAVLADFRVLFVARAEADRLVSSGISIGARTEAYCTATGRVLLAHLAEGQVRAYLGRTKLVALTPKTLTLRSDVLDAVRAAQRNGFAMNDEELELGLRAVAVPVIDARGGLVGAMSASASSARFTAPAMIAEVIPVLRCWAQRLGKAF
jgi:IclR family transcriptional regulator, pca regulon regulatory protein